MKGFLNELLCAIIRKLGNFDMAEEFAVKRITDGANFNITKTCIFDTRFPKIKAVVSQRAYVSSVTTPDTLMLIDKLPRGEFGSRYYGLPFFCMPYLNPRKLTHLELELMLEAAANDIIRKEKKVVA